MCGIAGFIGVAVDQIGLEKMLHTLHRRGPDGKGIYEDQVCTLLHTRLAIVDPAGGAQPMELCYGQEHYVVSYNGELYNTHELRQELCSYGHRFLTHSDTEVLLHAYAQWGRGCLDRLNGIFAFAVWEKRNQRLFLARDRMGVKPLFYANKENSMVFASEIKTILESGLVSPVLDSEGVAQILLLGPGRTPGSGVFRDIKELEPGCCATWESGRLSIMRYWSLQDRPHEDSFEETKEKVRWLVMDTVRRQMVSDVPVGTFLSGGLDSSLITAICSRESSAQLDTFSVSYVDHEKYFVPGKFQPNSDGTYIDIMQRHLNTNHHSCVLSPESLVMALEASTQARDLPGMADVDFSLLAFCEDIRQHVKVALSGECADEIFGGYPWYRDPEVRATEGFPWAQNTAYRAAYMLDDRFDSESFVMDHYLQTIRQSDILPDVSSEERRTKEMVNLNLRWFMQTLLDRKDRMSMYHGLEVRVPFCDHRIAEYLYCVPWRFKDHMGKEKGLLRQAMVGILPEEILWRKKSPYPKTHDPQYTQLIETRLRHLLKEKDAPIFSIVRKDALHGLLEEDHPWPWYGQLMRRPQTMAYMLQINAWLQMYQIQII